MKKLLTLLAFAIPLASYSQATSSGSFTNVPGSLGLILSLVITILIFLALRSIMLWYWKVETMLQNQEETNQLLRDNYNLLNEYIVYMKEKEEKTPKS
ncbi:hypothetical protein [Pedobacter nyackensis]|uniref:hypothetical protein n=1 Tax=Pedobacter nyackensis TaxID=475255 RepID=UPI002931B64B|nr:hypothetical protein [Pedobacter nyackensis]